MSERIRHAAVLFICGISVGGMSAQSGWHNPLIYFALILAAASAFFLCAPSALRDPAPSPKSEAS